MKIRLSFAQLILILAATSAPLVSKAAQKPEIARWEQEARNVTIIRDDWGVAHVYGKTDADTVFGALYAQAEDDFNSVLMGWPATDRPMP